MAWIDGNVTFATVEVGDLGPKSAGIGPAVARNWPKDARPRTPPDRRKARASAHCSGRRTVQAITGLRAERPKQRRRRVRQVVDMPGQEVRPGALDMQERRASRFCAGVMRGEIGIVVVRLGDDSERARAAARAQMRDHVGVEALERERAGIARRDLRRAVGQPQIAVEAALDLADQRRRAPAMSASNSASVGMRSAVPAGAGSRSDAAERSPTGPAAPVSRSSARRGRRRPRRRPSAGCRIRWRSRAATAASAAASEFSGRAGAVPAAMRDGPRGQPGKLKARSRTGPRPRRSRRAADARRRRWCGRGGHSRRKPRR